MKLNSIRNRILVWVGTCLAVTILGGLLVSAYLFNQKANQARSAAIQVGEDRIVSAADKMASVYYEEIEHAFIVVREVRSVLSLTGRNGRMGDTSYDGLTRAQVISLLHNAIHENPDLLSIYSDWEPDGFDGKDSQYINTNASDALGRFMPWWARSAEGITLQADYDTYEGELAQDYYNIPRETKKEIVLDPYQDNIDNQSVLMTSVIAPILSSDNQFLGMTGVDIAISNLQKTIQDYSATIYAGSAEVIIVSESGNIIADSKSADLAGKPLSEAVEDAERVMDDIKQDKRLYHDADGDVHAYAPIALGDTGKTWTAVVIIPENIFTHDADLEFAETTRWLVYMTAGALGMMLLAFFALWQIANSIARPIQTTVQILERVSQGDLTQEVPASLREKQDETGLLARATHSMSASLRQMFNQLTNSVQTLASTSAELSAISEEMNAGAVQSSNQANVVAGAAREMTGSTASAAADVNNANQNLASVAASTEQMTSTIGAIARSSENARRITHQAAEQADLISASMLSLSQAAQAIDKITETINSISSQTHLLALNATIESARAGAAGKGFAVVANEIKELSQQTAGATTEIRERINVVQESTRGAVNEIEAVIDVIRQVNENVASIASAIEEQSIVTRDIAGNIGLASSGVSDAGKRVSQTVASAQRVADEISGVSLNSERIASASEQVQVSAFELARLAEAVQELLGKYKI
jgi:methyl-accepting chemotaxis protein